MKSFVSRILCLAMLCQCQVDELDHYKLHGFPKYETAMNLMTKWTEDNSNIVTHQVIGKSIMDRNIDAYVLAANRQPSEHERPRILLTALMHAREPAGLTVVMYFFEKIIDNYKNNNPEAVYLLENREIWIIPFVNPDGYIDNQSGGRGRRKNMRKTCSRNEYLGGVDLNRNFAYKFVKNNDYCGEEYSGSHAFSEPETLALKNLVEGREFKTCMNFHSYGSMLTHPFNHAKKPTLPAEDQAIFNEIGEQFHYTSFGPAQLTVGYTTTGEADDWFYGTHGIISMSPEVGPESGGFWPPAKEIQGIDHRNFARISYVTLKSGFELQQVTWRKADPPGSAQVEFVNAGLSPSRGDHLYIGILGLTRQYNPAASLVSITDVETNAVQQHFVVTKVDQKNDFTRRDELPDTMLLYRSTPFIRRDITKFKFTGAGIQPEPASVIFCILEGQSFPVNVCRCHHVTNFIAHSQHRDIQFVRPPKTGERGTILEKACQHVLESATKWSHGGILPEPDQEPRPAKSSAKDDVGSSSSNTKEDNVITNFETSTTTIVTTTTAAEIVTVATTTRKEEVEPPLPQQEHTTEQQHQQQEHTEQKKDEEKTSTSIFPIISEESLVITSETFNLDELTRVIGGYSILFGIMAFFFLVCCVVCRKCFCAPAKTRFQRLQEEVDLDNNSHIEINIPGKALE